MNNETPINVDGSPDLMGKAGQLLHAMRERAGKAVCLLDARMRTLTVEPEEGAATAEYAVVLVAATGFAAVLVGIMKSDAIKTLLTNIIKENSIVLCSGAKAEEILKQSNHIEEIPSDGLLVPGMVSRKKQFLPSIIATLQQ